MGVLPTSYRVHKNLALAERNRLVLEQLPQVRCIAQKIHARLPPHIQLEDLVNTGVLGLIEALAKFDPERNVQLQSYARYRIQGAILDSLREQDWSPRLLRQRERQLEMAREKLRAQLGRSPSQAELAAEVGISDRQFQRLLGELQGLNVTSLQEPAFLEGHSLGEKMADTAEENPFALCERAEMSGLLEQAMSKLPPRKRQLLELYYFKGLTMREAGIRMGVCESRVSQIHSAAVASLKTRMNEILLSRQKEELVVRRPQEKPTSSRSVALQAQQRKGPERPRPELRPKVSSRTQRRYAVGRRYRKSPLALRENVRQRA
ncbi:MAG: FliA/WhiG family RNA polymerase sigma factor [Acidobacteriota bacterium]